VHIGVPGASGDDHQVVKLEPHPNSGTDLNSIADANLA
jgi:hypothetical protein